MPFTYNRTIRFQETDAAGVVFFTNVLAICHEAYEASLVASGIDLATFFSNPTAAFPIVYARVDFLRPGVCGDRQMIHLTPARLSPESFEITYDTFASADPDRLLSKAMTRHVCIHPTSRQRQPLSEQMETWLKSWEHSV